jgi:hypothetical protein
LINLIIIKHPQKVLSSNVIILGDSHPQILNPDYFSSAQNFCQGNEPLVVTFWKLNFLLKNTEFDTLVVGFSYHNISIKNDNKFSDQLFTPNNLLRTYPIIRFKDIKRFRVDYKLLFQAYFKNMYLIPKRQHGNFLGHFETHNKGFVNDYKEKLNLHYNNERNT